MKKIIVVVIAVTVFVLLYFLTAQQQTEIDKQVKSFSSSADDSISESLHENNLDNKIPETDSKIETGD